MIYRIDDIKVNVSRDGKQCYYILDGIYYSFHAKQGSNDKEAVEARIVEVVIRARSTILKKRNVELDKLSTVEATPLMEKYRPVKIKG